MAQLTSKAITEAAPGAVLRDATIPGLHLRAFAQSKSFYLYFRTKEGKERKPKLGDFPLITLDQARKIAKAMLLEVALGKDPSADRKAARDAPIVSELCSRFLAREGSKKKTRKEDARYIDQVINPKLGHEKVHRVSYEMVDDVHKSMADTPYAANRVLALMSTMFNVAEKLSWRPAHSNPCRHVERFKEEKRRRYASLEEARGVAKELLARQAANPQSVAFIWLAIFTGARKSEIANARWQDLEGSVLRLPDSKTGAKSVYLPPPAMEALGLLPRTSGTITGIKDPKKLWDAVRQAAGCPDLRIHDLRHTFASAGLLAGKTLAEIGGLLGHASTQTTQRYAHLMEDHAHAAAASVADKLAEMFTAEK